MASILGNVGAAMTAILVRHGYLEVTHEGVENTATLLRRSTKYRGGMNRRKHGRVARNRNVITKMQFLLAMCGVADVDRIHLDLRGIERLVQDFACRPDKGLARTVLLVPGLFTDQHDRRRTPSLSEDSLLRRMEQLTHTTVG